MFVSYYQDILQWHMGSIVQVHIHCRQQVTEAKQKGTGYVVTSDPVPVLSSCRFLYTWRKFLISKKNHSPPDDGKTRLGKTSFARQENGIPTSILTILCWIFAFIFNRLTF